MSRKIRIIFTISILLNVLLLGTLGGMAFHNYSERGDHMQQMTRNMSPEGRHIVAKTMQDAFREGRDKMKEMRKTKKEIKEILSAEEFDADAFEQASQKMHKMFVEMGQKRIEVTKELALQLSPEDRVELSERFSKGFKGYNPKEGGDKAHKFLKELDNKPARSKRDFGDGPELPADMPPQP